ncbi:molybdopterin biosynthesis protein MoeB [Arthrobacter sp. MYb229]|uniref:ThiF family adenylyltransferase n=1 Tax=Micrococcaceae TaxID=1268 RepID=UPI000CFD77B9|nr:MULTISPECIES: ThiF family adenylyltransferase [unclassified Arthrobacter]PRA02996.1 molybdopterin biosynthesis protein MoeB [Arthrobacter sp. MYb229]PRB49466.1 molybdopterin biosynthesis protein MoeB [Arthrobacter sp. MYb216]
MNQSVSPGGATPPAAVQVGAELNDEQRARAQRQLSLPGFGFESQRRLAHARVLVIGAGGLGCASVPYLVGAGVGTIGLVDDDVVELSNLHRQVAHTTANLGVAKTSSLAQAAKALDPSITVVEHNLRLTAENALEIFAGYDLVVDGSDNFPTRYLVNDAAQISGIPLIWGSILAHHGQVSVAWHAYGPGYRDLFPSPPEPGTVVNCAVGGVLPGLCGTVGSLLATETLKVITGLGDLLIGRVLIYDALAGRTREIAYGRDPQGKPVSELIDYELFCAGAEPQPEAISASELAGMMRSGDAPRLLDVRTLAEREQLRIAGSQFVPLDELEAASQAEQALVLPGSGELIVYCARDPRSIRAAQLLAKRGVPVRYLSGGIHEFAPLAPEFTATDAAEASTDSLKENS